MLRADLDPGFEPGRQYGRSKRLTASNEEGAPPVSAQPEISEAQQEALRKQGELIQMKRAEARGVVITDTSVLRHLNLD